MAGFQRAKGRDRGRSGPKLTMQGLLGDVSNPGWRGVSAIQPSVGECFGVVLAR